MKKEKKQSKHVGRLVLLSVLALLLVVGLCGFSMPSARAEEQPADVMASASAVENLEITSLGRQTISHKLAPTGSNDVSRTYNAYEFYVNDLTTCTFTLTTTGTQTMKMFSYSTPVVNNLTITYPFYYVNKDQAVTAQQLSLQETFLNGIFMCGADTATMVLGTETTTLERAYVFYAKAETYQGGYKVTIYDKDGISEPTFWTKNNPEIGYGSPVYSNVSSSIALRGERIQGILPATPTRTGYTFAGWYYDAALTDPYEEGDVITVNTNFYAKWIINTYDIQLIGDGWSRTKLGIEHGSTIDEPFANEVVGKTFVGWYADAACTVPFDFDTTRVTSPMAIYAKYDTIMLTVTFYVEGEVYATFSVPYGTTLIENGEATAAAAEILETIDVAALVAAYGENITVTADTELSAVVESNIVKWNKLGMWFSDNWLWLVIGAAAAAVVAFLVVYVWKRI